MPDPVIHHIELCVFDAYDTLNRLKNFGFSLFAKRQTASCQQLVTRLGSVFFLITERSHQYKPNSLWQDLSNRERTEKLTVLCCEDAERHRVDTVFNLAFSVKKSDVKDIPERICSEKGGDIVQYPTEISDENGTIYYSIVRSNCGNIVHSLINKDNFEGAFLPGFEIIDERGIASSSVVGICGIDHCTFATYSGNSQKVINFYEKCFGMQKFNITSNEDETNGLIIADGVGLRLRAMEYWRCSETGLSYKKNDTNARENSFLLVIVESLEGQTNCNVESYLKHHGNAGIEHIALKSTDILGTVSELRKRSVSFRNPPRAYYDELRNLKKISSLDVDLNALEEFGILLDNEDSSENNESESREKKYLMQIFANPLFDVKTFFIEIIERAGARGLGSGNILALVRSIREDEARRNKMKSEAKTQEITKESFTSPRQC